MERENDDRSSLLEIPPFLRVTRADQAERTRKREEFYRKERAEEHAKEKLPEVESQKTITCDGRVWVIPESKPRLRERRRKSSDQMKALKRLGWKGVQLAKLSPEAALGVISRGEEPPPRERKKRGRKKKRETLQSEREVLRERVTLREQPKRRREVLID